MMILDVITLVNSACEIVPLTEPTLIQCNPAAAILMVAGTIISQMMAANANKQAKSEADRLKREQDETIVSSVERLRL